jgi:glycosyltransferase involved in cell wall biosynthesis
MHVLPIPSTIPGTAWPQAVDAYRSEMASNGGPVVGHFGTYGAHVETALQRLLPSIAAAVPDARFAFMGAGSREFLTRLRSSSPDVAARSWASGRLDPPATAAALRACTVLIQPYPDGITTRRTSVMAGLRNAVATISTHGALTEPVWMESGAVALAPVGDVDAFSSTVASLLRDPVARVALSRRGAETYAERFSVERTIAVLRDAGAIS